ncbi:MAG: hypothetical protein K6U14_09650 [Firmicutes bacterium]|nr:hypothetical protein [Alicyclobacillaceae bacterium]MCL6497877.1 hypothetical protein [Bacillota bacterium]
MVTALWASSSIVVEIDTGYAVGISAIWFGVSVAILSVLVSLLLPWFRKMGYTSNSDLLGGHFGQSIQRLSGIIIGATFPIFAMSNALFAGVFLHALLHWPLAWSMALTTAVLIVYIQFAGLVSLAATQGLNLFFILLGLVVMVALVAGWHPTTAHVLPPSFHALGGAGTATIWVWFGTNLLNVFSAQAELQAVTAARSVRHAQWAVWISSAVLAIVVGIASWLGMAVHQRLGMVPGGGLPGLAALILAHGKPWEVVLAAVGVWALALTWCGPLLFSGAISLGRDVMGHQRAIQWTKVALVVEGLLMIGYALWRPEELAWWRVFGLTLRNAGVVGPTVALLLWGRDLPGRGVMVAMLGGIAVGLGLNAATGFSATRFIGGIDPMWAAQAAAFLLLAGCRWWSVQKPGTGGVWALASLAMVTAVVHPHANPIPLAWRGAALLGAAGLAFGFTWWATRQPGLAGALAADSPASLGS